MYNKANTVDIVGIDSDKLDKDLTFPEGYAFYIKLSAEPDSIWRSYLSKWYSALKATERKISVEGDKLRLVFNYGDNLQNFTSYAIWLVKWVNSRVAEHNNQIMSLEKDENRRKEIQLDQEERILQELKQVKPEVLTAPMVIAIKELASACAKGDAEYEKYRNSMISIKGIVREIAAKHNYITLTDEYKSPNNIVCVFDKGHSYMFKSLKKGKMVTVIGEFEGSVVQLSMRHCILGI